MQKPTHPPRHKRIASLLVLLATVLIAAPPLFVGTLELFDFFTRGTGNPLLGVLLQGGAMLLIYFCRAIMFSITPNWPAWMENTGPHK